MHKPKLRPLEAIPVEKDLICLRDPLQFSGKMLFIAPNVFYICTLLDGKNSLEEIENQYSSTFKVSLSRNELQSVIDKLESVFFLESDNFLRQQTRIISEFKNSPVRAASHAGTAYHKEPEQLIEQLNGLFTDEEGPGLPFPSADTPPEPLPAQNKDPNHPRPISALIAPHIDVNRGGICFARSYFKLAQACRCNGPVTFVIFGISHTASSRRFILTNKDFQTPLGTVPVNRPFLESLEAGCSYNFYEDELLHRTEHSIEFQVLFLSYLFRDRNDISIVPVLCSSLNDLFDRDISPVQDPEVGQFHEALVSAIESTVRIARENVHLIAGVDLAHLGRRFGQEVEVTEHFLHWAEQEDKKMLDIILAGDAEGFFKHIKKEEDKRNVCGVPALYTLLTLLNRLNGPHDRPGHKGKLITYDMAADKAANSVVTFTGISFHS